MNKEIKEILQDLKEMTQHDAYLYDNYLTPDKVDKLINNISYENNLDYKSRNEKAIEYINSFYETPEYIDAYDITYWVDEVKKILIGDDKNE